MLSRLLQHNREPRHEPKWSLPLYVCLCYVFEDHNEKSNQYIYIHMRVDTERWEGTHCFYRLQQISQKEWREKQDRQHIVHIGHCTYSTGPKNENSSFVLEVKPRCGEEVGRECGLPTMLWSEWMFSLLVMSKFTLWTFSHIYCIHKKNFF